MYNIRMEALRFEWDPAKARSNLVKHGVSFEEAVSAFADESGKVIPSPDHADDEDRFVLLGFSKQDRLLIVVHCFRIERLMIRIISARKATRKERSQYGR